MQPAAKEVGTALQTVAKAIHVVLAPVAALVWGYEKIGGYLNRKLSEKLKDVPPERIAEPSLSVTLAPGASSIVSAYGSPLSG
jgi:hypothetical protein